MEYFLALGSNLEPKEAHLRQAYIALQALTDSHITLSPIYKSDAYQTEKFKSYLNSDFLNCVLAIHTQMEPHELLAHTQQIENSVGPRQKPVIMGEKVWLDRKIDIDLILCGNQRINTKELTIPHYDLQNRIFFIKPLLDIKPDIQIPKSKSIKELYDAFDENEKAKLVLYKTAADFLKQTSN